MLICKHILFATNKKTFANHCLKAYGHGPQRIPSHSIQKFLFKIKSKLKLIILIQIKKYINSTL